MLAGRVAMGHPVDVASGAFYCSYEDVWIPGLVDLVWRRRYNTALLDLPDSPMGRGWSVPYFATLWRQGNEYHVALPEGGEEVFDDSEGAIARGGVIRHFGTFQELTRDGHQYVLTRWDIDTLQVERCYFSSADGGENVSRLTSIQGLSGAGLFFSYDAAGRLNQIEQRPENRTLDVEYDARNLVRAVSFRMPNGERRRLVRYEYDRGRRLVAAFNALGHADRFEYDANSLMTRELQRDGAVFDMSYDDQRRCVRTSGRNGYDEKMFRYYDHIGWTEVTDSHANVTRFQWLPSGQVVEEITPGGGVSRTDYDEFGRIVEQIDPLGASTRYAYDETGNLAEVTNAMGRTIRFRFGPNRELVEYTSLGGSRWVRQYDHRNRLVASRGPEGATRRWEWSESGRLVRMTNPRGHSITFEHGEGGEVVRTVGYDGSVVECLYHPLGLPLEVRENGRVTRYTYDAGMNLVSVVAPDGGTCRYQHDAGGNLIRFVNFDGAVTSRVFGPCSRTLEIVRADNLRVRFQWDTEPDRLLGIEVDGLGTYSYSYDANGNVVREVGFDGRETRYAYDLCDMKVSQANSEGETTSFERDPTGRVVKKVCPDGSATEFAYDDGNRLAAVSNDECTVEFEYDGLGRVVAERQDDFEVRSAFDPSGLRMRRESSLGQLVECSYGPGMELESLGLNGRLLFRCETDRFGGEVRRSIPGGLELRQNFDLLGRIVEQWVGKQGAEEAPEIVQPCLASESPEQTLPLNPSTLVHRVFSYEDSGNISRCHDARWGAEHYTYDRGDRVTDARRDRGASESFVYDRHGRRVLLRCSPGGAGQTTETSYEHGAANQVIRAGDDVLDYNVDGCLVRRVENAGREDQRVWEYEWNGDGLLAALTRPSGARWEYFYDGLGRRTRKVGPDGETRFLWDRDDIVHEVTGETWHSWIHHPRTGRPLAQLDGEDLYACVTDWLGTPRELLGESGTLDLASRLRTWGELDAGDGEGIECPVRLPGQWYNAESGLHYNRFRYYDPGLGCYISRDPYRMLAGFLEYAYAPNPLMWIDFYALDSIYVVRRPDGTVRYVGITNENQTDKDVALRRQGEHRQTTGRENWKLEVIATNVDHDTARGVEQGLIDRLGGPKSTGGAGQHLANKINSMSPDNSDDHKYSSGKTRKERMAAGKKTVDDFLENEKKKKKDC